MHFADAPVVPGCNADHPETVMACLLDNYPEAFQDRYLKSYAQAGYTHLQRSVGHAMWYGHDLASYNALSKKARAYGLFCDHWLMGGGEGDGNSNPFKVRDADRSYWGPFLQPYIASIVDSGTMDHCCVGWQLDQFNVPGNPILSNIQVVAEMVPQAVPLFTHWQNEALAWWLTGGQVWSDQYQTLNVHDRFTFWYACQPYLTGGHHQGSNAMALGDMNQYQGRLCDTLNPFTGDNGKGVMGQSWRGGTRQNFRLTAFEVTAQWQFGDSEFPTGNCTEEQGDQAGYLTMCTVSSTGLPMSGYGNGGRLPSGLYL